MSKPVPKPSAPAELLDLARGVIKAGRFPVLATMDGDQPRLRPVSPVRTDGFTVFELNPDSAVEPHAKVCRCFEPERRNRIATNGHPERTAKFLTGLRDGQK